jgi:uncharacterized protein (TIGR04255 family)
MPGWTFEEPNPITRCVVQIALAGSLPPAVIRDISATHGQFKRELPRKLEQQMLTVQMGGLSGPGRAFPPTHDLGGVVFDYVNPLGQSARALIVGPNFINYFTTNYTRWEEFWPFALRLLTEVSKRALGAVPIMSLKLEYHDSFNWEGPRGELNLPLLFRNDSEYLSSWFLRQRDICHNYQGWGRREQGPEAGQRIDNLNIAIGDDPANDTFVCSVVIGHSKQFNTPLKEEEFVAIFERLMNEMHKSNKRALLSVLNRDMAARISGLQE